VSLRKLHFHKRCNRVPILRFLLLHHLPNIDERSLIVAEVHLQLRSVRMLGDGFNDCRLNLAAGKLYFDVLADADCNGCDSCRLGRTGGANAVCVRIGC
jgi:hypothetical protein